MEIYSEKEIGEIFLNKWIIKNTKADLNALSKELKTSKLVCKIISNRGLSTKTEIDRFLNSSEKDLYDSLMMKDMKNAVSLVIEAIKEKKKVRIIGDYDQDGISSTVILYKGIANLTLNIDYDTPDRAQDGYGLNRRLVEKASKDGVDLIITCDNGISAVEAVDCAKELGMKIIVTDHHDVPFEIRESEEKAFVLPNADAVVNPKRPDCQYPFKGLCGAGVAFKLIEALYKKLNINEKKLEELYEFLALATVCDVMDLVDENRIFVKRGLENFKNTSNLGLYHLIEATNLKEKRIGTYHLGFILGPCINASGRLETAKTAIDLFLTDNEKEAEKAAYDLVSLNEKRKRLTEEGIAKVIDYIRKNRLESDKIIVAKDPEIHESIAGIIAGKIREKYNKPTIVITSSSEEGIVKASARSIEEYDMFKELSNHSDLFIKFGGHPMAAGFSMIESNAKELRVKLNSETVLTEEDFIPKVYLDAAIPINNVSMDLISSLEVLEPFGKGNSRPLFGDKDIMIERVALLGKSYKILKLQMRKDNKSRIEAVYFGDIEKMQCYLENKFGKGELEKAFRGETNDIKLDIVYYPSINEYNGRRTVQIVIQDYR